MRKFSYYFLAFLALYLTILSGTLLPAFFHYKEYGNFILSEKDFLSPIKPAAIALIIQIFIAKLLPAKSRKSDDNSEN